MSSPLFTTASAPPGWFGKLPGMGDFAHRRLPESFRTPWDEWLQTGLLQLRHRYTDWTVRYLDSPLWFFVLGAGVTGPRPWLGVLMPSVDGVGRYFPFTVAYELVGPPQQLLPAQWPSLLGHWSHAAHCALTGLDQDLDAAGMDALLADVPARVCADSFAPPLWPEEGQSLWLTDVSNPQALSLRTAGLPRQTRFERLFGFDDAADGLHV